VISGWGSLANYLKFLPTTGGLLPPIMPAAASAGASASTPTADEPPAEKLSFWDVLRPLTEQNIPAEAVAEADESAEQALNEVRRQISGNNSRRRRPRRS
jgi:YidC/Oxa1 family membrane protein insertase